MMLGPAMKHLLLLAALLLLSNVPTESRVVTSMAECNQLFLQRTPPNIRGILERGEILDQHRYKVICQILENTQTFVTLYDTENKIPVFSAAKYRGDGGGGRPNTPWKIEPQLEDPNGDSNMTPSNNFNYNHQAGNQDYTNDLNFDRGHLFPSSYGSTETEKKSTFTLTNIVPQKAEFNQGRWNKMEQCIKCVLDKYCINNNNKVEGFVVIGAKPSNGNRLNNKINIPSVLWSAFCCYSQNLNTWLAGAHWSENIKDGPPYLETRNLAELYRTQEIEAFPGSKCPPHTTVTHLDPRLSCTCT